MNNIMADFNKAIGPLLKKEGGYVNDPDDNGGETYKGISRKYHASSDIWKILDKYKSTLTEVTNKMMDKITKGDTKLQKLVEDIYKADYWDKVKLDFLNSQRIANMIFNDAVNRGVVAAIKTAQKVIGMKQTGKISPEFIAKLKNYGKRKNKFV